MVVLEVVEGGQAQALYQQELEIHQILHRHQIQMRLKVRAVGAALLLGLIMEVEEVVGQMPLLVLVRLEPQQPEVMAALEHPHQLQELL